MSFSSDPPRCYWSNRSYAGFKLQHQGFTENNAASTVINIIVILAIHFPTPVLAAQSQKISFCLVNIESIQIVRKQLNWGKRVPFIVKQRQDPRCVIGYCYLHRYYIR